LVGSQRLTTYWYFYHLTTYWYFCHLHCPAKYEYLPFRIYLLLFWC
jgi:hypothetical protein